MLASRTLAPRTLEPRNPGNIFAKEFSRDTIFLDRNMITPHFTPRKLLFRDKYIGEISGLLSSTLHGKKPDNIFIYGKVGTGKTSVAKLVMQQLLEFASAKNIPIEGNYVNCRNHNSKYRILSKIVKDFFPEEDFIGYSAAFIYEKLLEYARGTGNNPHKTWDARSVKGVPGPGSGSVGMGAKGNSSAAAGEWAGGIATAAGRQVVLVLDEIDKVKDLDELVYGLTRGNDELGNGSGSAGITIIGISNNLLFKDRLDPRTKSSLCEHEMVFPPYNAQELTDILKQRAELAFKPGTVEESAIALAAAIAAQESGDARTAVMLLLKAGEIADRRGGMDGCMVTDREVMKAKVQVEEELVYSMISTLPEQQQLVLYSIATLSLNRKPVQKITGEIEEGILFSGEVYDEYCRIAKKHKETVVSSRWYREYISELEMYGLIYTTASGKGIKGQTTLIKLGFEAEKIKGVIERGLVEAH